MKIELPYDPTISLLGIYIGKNMAWKDTFTPVFIVALCTIFSTQKQPKCPQTGTDKEMWYIYTTEYYSATKWNKIMPGAATQTDLETVILREVSQREKDKYMVLLQFSSVQSLSRVWLSVTPWTMARQASLSITNSQSPSKTMSIE